MFFAHVSALGLASVAAAVSGAEAGLIPTDSPSVSLSPSTPPELLVRQDDPTKDPTNFGWVEKWAAIGDR
jgi:hypothetical protein